MLIRFFPTLDSARHLLRLSAWPLIAAAGALSCPAGSQVILTDSGATTTYTVPTATYKLYVPLPGTGAGDPFGNGGSGGAGRSANVVSGVDIVDPGHGPSLTDVSGAARFDVGQAAQLSSAGGDGSANGVVGRAGDYSAQYLDGYSAGSGGAYYYLGGDGGNYYLGEGGGSSLTSGLGHLYGEAGTGQTAGGTTAANYINGVGVGGPQSDGGNGKVILKTIGPAPGSLPIFGGLASVGGFWLRRITRSRRR